MGRWILWFVVGCLLIGCGRLVTPETRPGIGMPGLRGTELRGTEVPGLQGTEVRPTAQTVGLTNTPRPTSTPRPATPMATPTPTVTPTPIIYTVQSGDTLLKIAIQLDRSTEAIQEANGIVDPRFLQIGQELIIPPPETDPEDPATPTPTPPPLVVEAINFQETRQGSLWCLGEVSNPGSEALTEVVIEAALFDGAGILLARAAAFSQLDVVLPDQAVPFAILFETPPGNFAQYQVVAVAGVPLSDQARYYFDLEAFDLQGSPEGAATYRLKGQLRNRGDFEAESIRLVAVAYDQENKVLAQRQAELAVSLLKAGATTPFEIDLIVPYGIVDRYDVLVQGLKVQ